MRTDKAFTGHQLEGSLYYMKARFYDPAVGRFLQPDSIVPDAANPQSLNRYSYVLNNPLRYTIRVVIRPHTPHGGARRSGPSVTCRAERAAVAGHSLPWNRSRFEMHRQSPRH